MALAPRLSPQQRQTLALTPAVRTALTVLRMNAAELEELAITEAARNPFLLRVPGPSPYPHGLGATEAEAGLVARAIPFQEALAQQIGLMALPEDIAALARLLIAELREDGYLDTPLAELARLWQLPLAQLETALAALQRCEPAGVAARDLRECLMLQLVDAGLDSAAAAQTVAHLPLFATADWAAIRRRMGLDRGAAQDRAAMLRALSPRPVAPQAGEQPPPALPDLVLERLPDGALRIRPARDRAAPLMLDQALAARAGSEGFARDMLKRARALIDALAQRGRTLARIGDWLTRHQAAFLMLGPQALRPVTRAALAQDLGLHPSTVGRAVAGKYLDLDGRLVPLTRLFSAALPGADGPVAAFTLQQRIAGMIGTEDPAAPLSDAAIAAVLHAEGVDIARRTVAKYRQVLRIPGSAARRRHRKLPTGSTGQNDRAFTRPRAPDGRPA